MPIPEGDHRIRLLRTAFVVYYHEDLSKARDFLADFGLEVADDRGDEIFYRGYGAEPFVYVARQAKESSEFGGGAYEVESRDELTRRSPEDKHLAKLTVNYEDEKPRKGKFLRFKPGPVPVHRWGHYGVTYPEGSYQTMVDWYTQTLALAASDVVYKGNDPITCFFHIDRGLEFTDHHAFFFKKAKQGEEPTVAHAAFEVHDFDTQQLGHQYLADKGHQLCWGVGRHVLGSQIFDYWFDSSKFVLEHYADGDLVNSATKVAHLPAGPEALSIWGPPVPPVF